MATPCEFRTAPVLEGRSLLLGYAVIGWIPVMCVREILVTDQPIDEVIQLSSVSGMAVFVLGWLTYTWLEYRLFGESVCRMPALPAPGAKRFEAEIECNLPLDSAAPIIARLQSQAPYAKNPKPHWRVEQRIDPGDVRRLDEKRVVVPVRMDIPGNAVTAAARKPGRGLSPVWSLELSRKNRGVNFRAQFIMPIADPSEVPPSGPPPR